MKSILALVSLVLVTLIFEEKARQIAGEAKVAYGQAADQARSATHSLSRSVQQQPLTDMLIAGALGCALAWLAPR